MLLDGSGFTSLSLCFPLLPLYQHVLFPAPSLSVWLEEAEPLVLAPPGRAGWLLFLWGDCEDIGAVRGLWKAMRKKSALPKILNGPGYDYSSLRWLYSLSLWEGVLHFKKGSHLYHHPHSLPASPQMSSHGFD